MLNLKDELFKKIALTSLKKVSKKKAAPNVANIQLSNNGNYINNSNNNDNNNNINGINNDNNNNINNNNDNNIEI